MKLQSNDTEQKLLSLSDPYCCMKRKGIEWELALSKQGRGWSKIYNHIR